MVSVIKNLSNLFVHMHSTCIEILYTLVQQVHVFNYDIIFNKCNFQVVSSMLKANNYIFDSEYFHENYDNNNIDFCLKIFVSFSFIRFGIYSLSLIIKWI